MQNGDSEAKIDPSLNTEVFYRYNFFVKLGWPQRQIWTICVIFEALSNAIFRNKENVVVQGQKHEISVTDENVSDHKTAHRLFSVQTSSFAYSQVELVQLSIFCDGNIKVSVFVLVTLFCPFCPSVVRSLLHLKDKNKIRSFMSQSKGHILIYCHWKYYFFQLNPDGAIFRRKILKETSYEN